MNSLKGNAALLQKLPVPQAVFPLATVLSGVVNLLFALVPLFAILVATGHHLTMSLMFTPVCILIATMFTLGVGLLLSPLALFFTDTVEIVGVTLTLVLYLTPVFYPISIIPNRLRKIVNYNPLSIILEVFREPIYDGVIPWTDVFTALLLAAVMLICGVVVFRRSSDRIPFYL